MKMYTKAGDGGITSTLDGKRIAKDCCLIQINGELDELLAQMDKVLVYMEKTSILINEPMQINRIRDILWQLGGEISYGRINKYVKHPITPQDIKDLESWMDGFDLKIKGFQRFSNLISLEINECRVRARKLERTLTKYVRKSTIREKVYVYMNRLSDYLFSLAVHVEILGEKK